MPSESPLITLTTRPTASSGSPKAAGIKTKTNNKAKRHIMTIFSPSKLPAIQGNLLQEPLMLAACMLQPLSVYIKALSHSFLTTHVFPPMNLRKLLSYQ
jgi:hypothetical protein